MIRRTLVAVLAALAVAAGCGRDNRGSVALTTLCFPPTPDTSTGACPLQATCDSTLANGDLWVDLATSGNTLEYPIQIDNQRPDNTDLASGRTNTNYAIIERFDMRYQAAGFGLPAASSLQTLNVPAAGTTVGEVQLIPAVAGAALAAALPAGPTTVTISVTAHGRYGDDTEFDTAPFQVPVSVTQGLKGPYGCSDPTKKLTGVCPQQGQTAVVSCQ
jgi:hypothetical protein